MASVSAGRDGRAGQTNGTGAGARDEVGHMIGRDVRRGEIYLMKDIEIKI